MAKYDFSTLNSEDFEELVCDLLNKEKKYGNDVKYRTFKEGKDKGVDFLYSTNSSYYKYVGQVKHYYRTGFSGLLDTIKKSEVKKVKVLNPERYIFVTSVDLTIGQTEKIKEEFGNYIKVLDDVYGKKDLNRLIEQFPEVIKQHFKLWLSDFNTLTKILTSNMEFRSSYFVDNELRKRIRIYVETPLFKEAKKALAVNKFVIITGEPGVGKTTLAEMLVYEYIAQGYNLSYIIDDIKEVEHVLVPGDSKEIIYFDDFLGSNRVEIDRAKGREIFLRRILSRVSSMSNKLIVLTTRSFLLTSFVEESETLERFNIKAKSSLFKLQEYTIDLKKQMLINHIEVSDLNEDLKNVLYCVEMQEFIVKHNNFTPRSIEFITSSDKVNDFNENQFKEFIIKNFDYPDNIWKHAYTIQITENDRILLNTLLSFGKPIKQEILRNAFENRLRYEVKFNNKQAEMFAFDRAFRRLIGGFILLKRENEVDFINPSLIDFLVKYLRNEEKEVFIIANSVKYISQLTTRLYRLSNVNNAKLPVLLESRIIDDYMSFVEDYDNDLLTLFLFIDKYITRLDIRYHLMEDILTNINSWTPLQNYALNRNFSDFLFENEVRGKDRFNLGDNFQYIVLELFLGIYSMSEAIEFLEKLFYKLNNEFLKLDKDIILRHLDTLFDEYIEEEIDWLNEWMLEEYEVHEKLQEINILVDRLEEIKILYIPNLKEFDIDWYEVALNNKINRQLSEDID